MTRYTRRKVVRICDRCHDAEIVLVNSGKLRYCPACSREALRERLERAARKRTRARCDKGRKQPYYVWMQDYLFHDNVTEWRERADRMLSQYYDQGWGLR